MKKREWVLAALLIAFGLVYQAVENNGCSIRTDLNFGDRFSLASEEFFDFAQPEQSFSGLEKIIVENPAGAVKVSAGPEDQVGLRLVFRVHHPDRGQAEELAAGLSAGVTLNNGLLTVKPEFQGEFPLNRIRVLVEAVVPATGAVEIFNRHGEVRIDSVSGPLNVDNRHGATSIEKSASQLNLRHAHGNLVLQEIIGPINADIQHSRVSVVEIQSMKSSGGYNEYQIRNCAGLTSLENSFGRISIEDCHSVEINSRHTPVFLRNIAAGVNLKGSYARLSLENVNGDTIITSRNSPISINNISSDYLLIKNAYDRVEVNSFRGHQADIDLRHGHLLFSFLEMGGRLNINTRHSNVSLSYPVGLRPSMNLRARQGRIVNRGDAELEILQEKTESTAFKQAGQPEIVINSLYGSITLKNDPS